ARVFLFRCFVSRAPGLMPQFVYSLAAPRAAARASAQQEMRRSGYPRSGATPRAHAEDCHRAARRFALTGRCDSPCRAPPVSVLSIVAQPATLTARHTRYAPRSAPRRHQPHARLPDSGAERPSKPGDGTNTRCRSPEPPIEWPSHRVARAPVREQARDGGQLHSIRRPHRAARWRVARCRMSEAQGCPRAARPRPCDERHIRWSTTALARAPSTRAGRPDVFWRVVVDQQSAARAARMLRRARLCGILSATKGVTRGRSRLLDSEGWRPWG